MTVIKELLMGEDIKEAFDKCIDMSNKSNVDIDKLDDWEIYYISKHIGCHEKYKSSGIFILDIEHMTEEFSEKLLL